MKRIESRDFMKFMKRFVVITILLCTMIVSFPTVDASVKETDKVTVKELVTYLKKETGVTVTSEEQDSRTVTNQICADLLVQAYHKLHSKELVSVKDGSLIEDQDGDGFRDICRYGLDEVAGYRAAAIANNVADGLLTDLSKASEEYKDDLILAYSYGLMGGSSNGKFSRDRKIKPLAKPAWKTIKKYVERIVDDSKALVITYDGQLTRTTNLPKNAEDYPYILASFPNSFYEMAPVKFNCGVLLEETAVSECLWAPVDVEKVHITRAPGSNTHLWRMCNYTGADVLKKRKKLIQKAYDSLYYKLNANYKTIDSTWSDAMKAVYEGHPNYDAIAANVDDYVEAMKKNQVIVESSKIVTDPSMIYSTYKLFYVRFYVEFTVKSAVSLKDDCRVNTIGFDCAYDKEYKKNKVVKAYVDVIIGSDFGSDFYPFGSPTFIEAKTAPLLTKSIYEYQVVEEDYWTSYIDCPAQH